MNNNVPDPSLSPQKHLLHVIWMLWREGGNNRPSVGTTADEWCTRLTFVTKVISVEEFWKFFNNFDPLSNLPIGMSLNFFQKDIKRFDQSKEHFTPTGNFFVAKNISKALAGIDALTTQ